jgi:hypothetical protein
MIVWEVHRYCEKKIWIRVRFNAFCFLFDCFKISLFCWKGFLKPDIASFGLIAICEDWMLCCVYIRKKKTAPHSLVLWCDIFLLFKSSGKKGRELGCKIDLHVWTPLYCAMRLRNLKRDKSVFCWFDVSVSFISSFNTIRLNWRIFLFLIFPLCLSFYFNWQKFENKMKIREIQYSPTFFASTNFSSFSFEIFGEEKMGS